MLGDVDLRPVDDDVSSGDLDLTLGDVDLSVRDLDLSHRCRESPVVDFGANEPIALGYQRSLAALSFSRARRGTDRDRPATRFRFAPP